MRHRVSGRKLKRTASHRKALLSSLSVSLIRHKRIRTTMAKAKETRMVVEKLITKAKNAVAAETAEKKNVHARRVIFAVLRDRSAVSALFNDIAPKVQSRPGGYTRVVKLGQRRGDGAHLAVLELVDFNTAQEQAAARSAAKAAKQKKKEARAQTEENKKPAAETAAAAGQ
jgi:large subunit ribosomal protein L17